MKKRRVRKRVDASSNNRSVTAPCSDDDRIIESDEDITTEIEDHTISEDNKDIFTGNKVRKIAIAYFYRVILRAPGESQWKGSNGIVKQIKSIFQLGNMRYRDILMILNRVNECAKYGI